MASIMLNLHTIYSPPVCYSSTSFTYKPQTVAFRSQSHTLLKPKKRSTIPIVVQSRNYRSKIYASQSNFFRALQTAYKVGKNGIEAGTTLVPESIPRPIARISVAVVGATVVLFLLKSFLSTAFFFLATAGLIYTAFIAFNKDDGPRTGGSGTTNTTSTTTTTSTDDETLEEARRIMEKYK